MKTSRCPSETCWCSTETRGIDTIAMKEGNHEKFLRDYRMVDGRKCAHKIELSSDGKLLLDLLPRALVRMARRSYPVDTAGYCCGICGSAGWAYKRRPPAAAQAFLVSG